MRQPVALGRGEARTTVSTRYDAVDDLSILSHDTGSHCCSDTAEAGLTTDLRGLLYLHVLIHRGFLTVEQDLP